MLSKFRSRSLVDKNEGLKDEQHLANIRKLPCCICGAYPSEAHHPREGNVGMGKKSPDHEAIPLCASHHRTGGYKIAYHAGRKAFHAKYGSHQELLNKTNRMLNGLSTLHIKP